MSSRAKTASYSVVVRTAFYSALVTCLIVPTKAEEAHAQRDGRSPQDTLFVDCPKDGKPKGVLSSVALSEGDTWRAYVEVNVQSDPCLNTTQLWTGRTNHPYGLVYLIPPTRDLAGNGMEILGWARNSRMLLVKTELWQWGSDAHGKQQLLAVDASTGEVYEPELEAMLQGHKGKQCEFRISDAGFSPDKNVIILVRAKFFSAVDVGDTEADVPVAKRCGTTDETWSFNYANGEIKQVGNAEPLLLFKKFTSSDPAK